MKKIKSKIALVLALACFTSSAFGEESGLFLGLGFGAHGAKQSIKSTKLPDENGLKKIRAMQSATDFGGAYYFGYKHIFDEHSGLRVYLNSESNNVEVEKSNGESAIRSYNIFGLGVDYLFNINPNFGLFVGINSAAISWDKEIWSLDWENDEQEYRGYVAAQMRLRGIFGEKKRHAVELFGKIPFTKTTFKYQEAGVTVVEMDLKQTYNVGLRYIYTFAMD